MSLFSILKLFHILLAIVAVGFNASYAVWLARAERESEHQLFTLRGIKTLDDRFANPAYGLLLLTGLSMVVVGHLSLRTFWIGGALVLWVITVLFAAFAYTPSLRRQIRLLVARGASDPEYRSAAGRARWTGIVVMLPVLAILFLMVVKPGG